MAWYYCFLMVFPTGIEPMAYCLGGSRSILLSYGNMECLQAKGIMVDGQYKPASNLPNARKTWSVYKRRGLWSTGFCTFLPISYTLGKHYLYAVIAQ